MAYRLNAPNEGPFSCCVLLRYLSNVFNGSLSLSANPCDMTRDTAR
jgi:hypothetical protein